MRGKGKHRQSWYNYGGVNAKGNEATAEEREIIRKVLYREIVNVKGFCLTWASMGSQVCRRHAEEMGWHGKEWGSTHGVFPMTEADRVAFKERQRQRSKEYAAAHREYHNEKCRLYRERLKAEREADKAAMLAAVSNEFIGGKE